MKGQLTLLDYQVFQNIQSDFIYRVEEDVEGFGLSQKLWQRLVAIGKYPESIIELKRLGFVNYRQGIYK